MVRSIHVIKSLKVFSIPTFIVSVALVLVFVVIFPHTAFPETYLLQQITDSTGGDNWLPSISADGTRVAFMSYNDLTPGSPGNADGNFEIFLSIERSPVYRFWSGTSHFYTISEADKAYVIATWPDIWTYEGAAFYAFPTP